MSRLSDAHYEVIRELCGFQSLSAGILALNAATAPTVKTTAVINYTSNGFLKSKAATAAIPMAPTHNAMGAANGAWPLPNGGATMYVVMALDAAGAIKVIQGSYDNQKIVTDPTKGIGAVGNMGTMFAGKSTIPDLPEGLTPFGLIKIVNNSANPFVLGTTALDAAGLVVTYQDVSLLPVGNP